VVEALFEGMPGKKHAIAAEMERIAAEREASQPLRSRTGGSTFRNPPGRKAWQLVDAAGCRGMTVGGAQVSEKHTNFLINTGHATSADIEALGEEIRARVKAHSGSSCSGRSSVLACRLRRDRAPGRRRRNEGHRSDGRLVRRARREPGFGQGHRRGRARAWARS
jgi:hypothetical protein